MAKSDDTLAEFDYDPDSADELYSRWSYGLTFARANEGERKFHPFGMTGPHIPNSYQNKKSGPLSNGSWDQDIMDSGDNVLCHVVSCVVNEAVHEALEWLRLDGEVLLDPHGMYETRIYNATHQLAAELTEIAKKAYHQRTAAETS